MNKEEIEALEKEHQQAPHLRLLQKALAKDITIRVHSEEDYTASIEASEILFGKGTTEALVKLSESDLLAIFEGVPQMETTKTKFSSGVNIIELLTDETKIFASRGEARKMIQGGGVSINKSKVEDINLLVSSQDLLNEKYLLVQKGKKNYYLISVV